MNVKKIINKKILPLLLAVALLFGISLVALAANGDGTGNPGTIADMAGQGSNFQLGLYKPYVALKPEGSSQGDSFALSDEFDANDDIRFTISLNPQGGQKQFYYVDFSGVKVYEKGDPEKVAVASFGNQIMTEPTGTEKYEVFYERTVEDVNGVSKTFNNERRVDLIIAKGTLSKGKTYCLLFPSTIQSKDQGKTLGVDVIVEFTTKNTSSTAVQSWTTGDCTATLYDDGLFIVEANDGGTGKMQDTAPPWFATHRNQIKKVEVKTGVTHIGNLAFLGCTGLTDVALADTVLSIGKQAFMGCSMLSTVAFSKNLSELGQQAFHNCDQLPSELTLPETVTSIGANAFCTKSIKDVYINSDADNITIHKSAYGKTGADMLCTFHVKCNQLDAFKEKNPDITNVEFEATHLKADPVKENEVAAKCTEEGSYDEVVYCSRCNTEISRETKTVDALGHKEEVIEAIEASCTEPGKTEGAKCAVCGETLKAQEDIAALGHDWEVIPEVISTCTKTGSTAGAKCTRCGEYLIEPKEVPMIRHDYQDGKCTVCGAEDPDYKPAPEEPDEPTPVEPVSKFTGLANEADKDGNWWYYTDGKIDKTHTGVDQNKYGWWRVENGKVNFKAQSIYKNAYGWWKTTDGKVTFKETGVFQNEYGWWRVEESKVNFNAQSIYQNQYGWWKTTNGKVTFKENGLFKNQYGTWKVENSKVNFNYNGTYQGKTIKNGKVQ